MKSVILACTLLFALVWGPSVAKAQLPPAGSIFDMAVTHPTSISGYLQFTTSFVADTTGTEYVSFAFREPPAFWAFDDASVVLNGTATNLLTDPGFESSGGTVGTNFPVGWGRWIQPIDTSAIGQVASNGAPYGCPPNLAHTGTIFWCDGSVQGYDGIYQGISVVLGQTYNISWWVADNSGSSMAQNGVDMLVYAGDNIPVGTVVISGVPEPATFGMVGGGLLAVAIAIKRRKAAR